jgi:hypothetical protein
LTVLLVVLVVALCSLLEDIVWAFWIIGEDLEPAPVDWGDHASRDE